MMAVLGLVLAVAFPTFPIEFHSDFEGGSLGGVEQVSATHFRCHVRGEADQNKRNRQASWYYFRIDGARGREVTFDLVDLVGEYNYRPGAHAVTKNTRPVYSEDNKTWKHFTDEQVSWNDRELTLRLRFTPGADRVWIAHVPPYTNRDLAALLREFARSPYLKRETIGRSAGRRAIPLLTVTNPATSEGRKKVVWLMFRQHAWETGSSWVCEGALRFLLSSGPAAGRIRDAVIFKILPMADPDGVARGGVRFNANGCDLNRNWDSIDPRLMPEIAAQRRAMFDWMDAGHRLDAFLTVHNTENGEYLEGPLEAGASNARALGQRLFRELVESTTFAPTMELRDAGASTAPGQPGRMTVNQALFHDRRVPAFLMEQMVEYNPKLGRLPTVQDRLEFGAALVRAMWQALAPGAVELSMYSNKRASEINGLGIMRCMGFVFHMRARRRQHFALL